MSEEALRMRAAQEDLVISREYEAARKRSRGGAEGGEKALYGAQKYEEMAAASRRRPNPRRNEPRGTVPRGIRPPSARPSPRARSTRATRGPRDGR